MYTPTAFASQCLECCACAQRRQDLTGHLLLRTQDKEVTTLLKLWQVSRAAELAGPDADDGVAAKNQPSAAQVAGSPCSPLPPSPPCPIPCPSLSPVPATQASSSPSLLHACRL